MTTQKTGHLSFEGRQVSGISNCPTHEPLRIPNWFEGSTLEAPGRQGAGWWQSSISGDVFKTRVLKLYTKRVMEQPNDEETI